MPTRFHTPAVRVNPGVRRAFHRDLLRWYRRHHRKLPWRATRDPYRIWVSEIMLQQTRVETVRPYYARWLKAFPTVHALARAKDDRVLKLWEGLGYYSRARNLHLAAKLVVGRARSPNAPKSGQKRTAGAAVPTTAAELLKLPGIGRYTAGAIASIAFDERVPLVDGNVARVFARIFAIQANVKSPRTLKSLWDLAENLLPDTSAGDFNQALMELGALVCTPANPSCNVCPIRHVCLARARGLVDQLPDRGDKPQTARIVTRTAFARRNGRILLQRRPERGSLANLWELPEADAQEFRVGRQLCEVRHTITHHRITLHVHECILLSKSHSNGRRRWVARGKLNALAMPAAHRRAIELVLRQLSSGM
jgi:A/G-specific adenine glycosylase